MQHVRHRRREKAREGERRRRKVKAGELRKIMREESSRPYPLEPRKRGQEEGEEQEERRREKMKAAEFIMMIKESTASELTPTYISAAGANVHEQRAHAALRAQKLVSTGLGVDARLVGGRKSKARVVSAKRGQQEEHEQREQRK